MMMAGFYLRLGQGLDPRANARVHALARALLESPPPGVTDVIPGYATLYLEFDPRRTNRRAILRGLARLSDAEPPEGREVRIPVRYDGPDLDEVARWAGLTNDEVIRAHAGRSYRVFAIGFTPGFPFMAEVDARIAKPRRAAPRSRVPAHAVGIAGRQTGVYPLESPGGWNLIGRTLVRIYDPNRDAPFLLAPGDRVRFVPEVGEAPAPPEALALLPETPRRPVLEVLSPGLLDLVLDQGRFMAGRFGLARSGPADAPSAAVANRLVGNPPGAPLLEMSLRGPEMLVLAPAVLAFAGYGLRPLRNGEPVPPWTSFAVFPGDRLSFVPDAGGVRGYLAVAGGFEVGRFWGSASVDLKGMIGAPLVEGVRLGLAREAPVRPGRSFVPYTRGADQNRRIRILPGPQATPEALEALTAATFVVRQADRMGVRLEGPEVPGGEVTSEAVPIGAIQVPPGGEPIVLLVDRGTLGGYAKPALVHPADLPRMAQLRAGDEVRFALTGRRTGVVFDFDQVEKAPFPA